MSESNKTFIYAVHPRKPITGIPGVPVIRTNKSVYLTKDDVIDCLRLAAVFRRFPEKTERVTIDNVDRLHRDSYISEEDWKKKMDLKKEDHSSTVPTVTMPETISNAEESLVEDKSEEQVEEAVVENVEETNSVEGDEESQEIDEEATDETVEESDSEEVVEDEVKEEDEITAETSEVVTSGDDHEPVKDNGAVNNHQKIGQIQYASNHNKKHNNNKRH